MNQYSSELFTIKNECTSLKECEIKKKTTVENVLKEMKLESRFYAVLVNGKKAEMDYILNEKDDLLILPKIAGGIEKLI
jgi:sulfur carrier protein ThiS